MKFLQTVLVCTLALGAGAAQAEPTNVKVGAEYRAAEAYDDVAKTSDLQLNVAKLRVDADLNSRSKFNLQLNPLAKVQGDEVEKAVVTSWLNGGIGFSLGKDRANFGGWDEKESGAFNLLPSQYASVFPTTKFGPAATVFANVGPGVLSVQGLNDVAGSDLEHKQPAVFAEWQGKVEGFAPILQVGQYDGTEGSMTGSVGVKTVVGPASLVADYTRDHRKSNDTNYDAVTAGASVKAGEVTPFAKAAYMKADTADGTVTVEGTRWVVGTTVGDDTSVVPFVSAEGTYGELPDTRKASLGVMGKF